MTGWETDDRGGTWEASPAGYFANDQFGFHVEWFRLRDTSTDHAVTIKHQIARQDTAVVTWEFRFMMSQIMDGATWQVRDLSAPAVSLMVSDGKLCCASAGATPLVLKQIEAGRAYGVRVVVDLIQKNARVFVDGQVAANSVSLLNRVATLDYVLISTGKQAQGDLYLPVVNVHIGYAVNESFLTAGTGDLPHDWNRVTEAGTVNVEQFKCSARPDVFSLRLADGGKAKKVFAAIGGKTVCECRFLLPEKRDGASIELSGHDAPVGAIQNRDGQLCCVDPAGRRTVLVQDYRENLWYAIRVMADSQSASAECYVNGKLTASDLSLGRAGIDLAQIQFAAPPEGTLWVDDVQVYSWREYPSDYVPEPEPVNQTDDYLVGTQSCSLWKEGDAYAGWDYVYPYADNRKPSRMVRRRESRSGGLGDQVAGGTRDRLRAVLLVPAQ